MDKRIPLASGVTAEVHDHDGIAFNMRGGITGVGTSLTPTEAITVASALLAAANASLVQAASRVTIWAYVTHQGTAMPEAALCDTHLATHYAKAVAGARDADDWDGGNLHDVTGNELIACIVCGTRGGGDGTRS